MEMPVPLWTLHVLRRTLATGLQRLGVMLEVTEAVLNHVSGSRAGIVGVYQRHDYFSEKRDALDLWAREVRRLARAQRRTTNANKAALAPTLAQHIALAFKLLYEIGNASCRAKMHQYLKISWGASAIKE